jgi:hypothetical protein
MLNKRSDVSAGDGLKAFESTHAVNITTLPGCAVNSPDTSGIAAVVSAAKTADVVVLFLGLDGSIENEGAENAFFAMPLLSRNRSICQDRLGTAVRKAEGKDVFRRSRPSD